MLLALAIGFGLLSVLLFYVIIVRPILTSPDWQEARDRGHNVIHALDRFRTMAVGKLIALASIMVSAYDLVMDVARSSGIDWTPVTEYVPPYAWPFITLAISLLFMWLRKITTSSSATPGVMIGKAPQ